MQKTVLTLICLFALQGLAVAGDLKTDNPERKPANGVLLTEQQNIKITKYSEMLAEEKYAEASSGLLAMLEKTRDGSGYARSVIHQLLGHIASLQGNYTAAAANFKKAIEFDSLPNPTHFQVMLQYAQLLMLGDDYRGGLKALDDYFSVADKIPDSAFALKANAHAQLNEHVKARDSIKQAIELSDKPNESWYQLLLAMHFELNEFQQAANVLEILVQLKPDKKEYWKQLSSVYFTLKSDKKSLAVLVLAYEKGLLDEQSEIKQLFKLYRYMDIPYKAGLVMEKGLKDKVVKADFTNLKELAETWYQAKELDKALVVYGEASQFAEDGEVDLTRAYLYIDQEKWKEARASIKSALSKGGLKQDKEATAWLMLGMSEASLGNYEDARTAMRRARQFEKTKADATQWLSHIEQLEKNKESQQASL